MTEGFAAGQYGEPHAKNETLHQAESDKQMHAFNPITLKTNAKQLTRQNDQLKFLKTIQAPDTAVWSMGFSPSESSNAPETLAIATF